MHTLLAVAALAGTPPTPEFDDAVSPATAQAWQKLSAETARFSKERSAACPGGAWRYEDPRALALQINQCGGMEPATAVELLVGALDKQGPDPIVAAGVVEQCPRLIGSETELYPSAYFTWKLCGRLADSFTDDSLDAALRGAGASDWVRLDMEIRASVARGVLADAAPVYQRVEQGYPAVLAMYNDALAQVDSAYMPRIEAARADLLAIDPWFGPLSGGPGFATGCHERWTGVLQRYVESQGVQAKGMALWEALRDPVSVGFTEALAACHKVQGDSVFSDILAKSLIPGQRRTLGWHQAMGDVLTRLRGTTFVYKGQPIAQDLSYGSPLLVNKNKVREYIGDHFESKNRPFGFEEAVQAVRVEGDTAILTFPKRKGNISAPANCGHDYSRPLGIDRFGNIDYPYGCSGSVVIATDVTYREAKIPAWQAEKIAPGVKVAVNFPPGVTYFGSLTSNTAPVDAQIVWVKRGEDVVWVAGVGL